MRPRKNIENIIKKFDIDVNPQKDKAILDEILQTREKSKLPKPAFSVIDIWRIIMTSKITRVALAVFIFAGLVSFLFLDNTVAPAYAVEETLEALQNLKTVHMICTDWADVEFEMWIKLSPETGEPEYCRAYWPKSQSLIISRPDRSYQYNIKSNYVQVNSGKLLNIGVAPGKVFEQLLKASSEDMGETEITIYREYDEAFGKELIVAVSKNPYQTNKVYIDPDTKLPVRLKGISSNIVGAFMKDADPIEFNVDFPADIFDFEIPEGARVHDHDQSSKLLSDPQNGMSTKGMTEQQVAEKIVTEYWNALVANDKNTAKKLSPVSPEIVDGSLIAELAKTGELYIQPGCGIGKLIPCTLKYKDGSFKRWNLIIKPRNIDGNESVIIASYYGGPMSTVIFPKSYDDPGYGLSTEGLSDDEASKAVVDAYWRAIIEADCKKLVLLYPRLNAEQWQSHFKNIEIQPTEILEIGQPVRKKDCTIGPVVPCRIKYSDGQVKNPYIAVKIRNIDGKKSCLIAGTYRGKKDSGE